MTYVKEMGIREMAVRDQLHHVDSVKNLIRQQSFHPYLQLHIGEPAIDEDRILFLSDSLNDFNLSKDESERYITTAMLVQMALDTHEQVLQKKSLKERQLTVLAGDFFSGMYYQMLAQIENISLIRTLASAIKSINEHKIRIYLYEPEGISQFVSSFKQAESLLLQEFSLHFGSAGSGPFTKEYFFLKRLISEKAQFESGQFSIFFEGLKKYGCVASSEGRDLPATDHEKLLGLWNDYAEESGHALKKMAMSIPAIPELIRERLASLLDDM